MPRPASDRLALLGALLSKGASAPRAAPIPRRAHPATAPLSSAQERLYFLETLEPGTALHNDTLLLRVRGALDAAAVSAALATIQQRHEILRTTFELGSSGPLQRIHERPELPFRVLDLGDAGAPADDARLARARALVDQEARRPFALDSQLAWRALLVRVADEEHWLSCTMHHALSDGASFGILYRELEELLAAARERRAPELAPLSLQFGDHAAHERAALPAQRAAEHEAYWKRTLDGERARFRWPASGSAARGLGGWVPVRFDAPALERLRDFARGESVTTNQALLAGWIALLARFVDGTAVRTGIASTLRRRAELEPLIGFFVQTLLVQVSLADDPDARTLVARVRAAALEAEEHAELPFDRVARVLQEREDAAGAPPCEAFFSHMRDAIRAPLLGSARSSWEFVDAGVARFPLSLVLHESATELAGFLEFDAGRVTPDAARMLASDYVRLIGAAAEQPGRRLSELAPAAPQVRPAGGPRRAAPLPARRSGRGNGA